MNRGGDFLGPMLYWIFYIPLTAAIVIGFVVLPTVIVENSLSPVDLDAAQMQEMLLQRIIEYEYPYGTVYQDDAIGLSENPDVDLILSNKVWGYKVGIKSGAGTVEYIDPDDFYGYAAPLAPFKYKRYVVERPFRRGIESYTVTVDVVYPKKYEFS